MSKELIGLLGAVGGALAGSLLGYLLGIRTELSEAMVSARLLREELDAGGSSPGDGVWLERREALARVLSADQWEAVARAYRRDAPQDARSAATRALYPLARGKRHQVAHRMSVRVR